jgi:ribose 1,5-bisphosphokinase PhnN
MFNVCYQCGAYHPDKRIDSRGPDAICPECGHAHRFRMLPLLVVSGASGTGKSTVCQALAGHVDGAVLLESDILWGPAYDHSQDGYRDFFEIWLRICKNIAQAGRPVVLFGAGAGVPDNLEPCVERRYFSTIHYLALTCEDAILTRRLTNRPAWRRSRSPEFIASQLRFNHWFQEAAAQGLPVDCLDTTHAPLVETTAQVSAWIQSKLSTQEVV